MVFKSSQNIFMVSLLWLIVLFLLVTPFLPDEDEISGKVVIFGFVWLYGICAMLIWILLDTKYTVAENFLYYSSGPIRGKIEIAKIQKLENVTTWYVSSIIKPALGSRGLTIRYEKFNDIYISPKDKEKFIAALLEINPGITVQ